MKKLAVLVNLAIAGCSTSTAVRLDAGGGRDAAIDAACDPSDAQCANGDGSDPRLSSSRASWDQLVAAMGDTYSYTEENCTWNATEHTLTIVQVDNGVARLFATTTIPSSECMARVNRYESFVPRSMPELYAQCQQLLAARGSDVTLEFDDRNVLRACMFAGSADCLDNCGEGFYLRALGFGALEVP